MIIKYLWEEKLYVIEQFANRGYKRLERSLELYAELICLIILTPIIGAFDLLLLPLEIGYYLFMKWTGQV